MSDFDYANARLRAMKSRLLSRRAVEDLTEAGSVPGLITALTNTPYREAVEAALVRLTGVECIAEALRNDLVATVGKARSFFPATGPAGALASVVLRAYDVHNVKAVLRGLARQVPASEILASTLPVGELRAAELAELARAANWRAAIDLLATWRVPLARPLLALRAGRREATLEPAMLELALDRWYFAAALESARESDEDTGPLVEALTLEADVTNILTALRLVGAADAPAALRDRFGADGVTALFVGPGHVSFATLTQAARQASLADAVNVLHATVYGPTLSGAMEGYSSTGRLSVFERALSRQKLKHHATALVRDPLGIGVLLGYVALKTNEVANLRAIVQGFMLGEKPERIRAEFMIVES
ncbi:MAG: V-type ATPase subunit [Chloroflexi bacterium]|nr:V-type ATPase subunit [Chloroflexota bacterium]